MVFTSLIVPLLSIPKIGEIKNTSAVVNATTAAPGRAFLMTLTINLPWNLLLFGSKIRINDGIPITNVSIKNNWFVAIGLRLMKQQ